MKISLDCGKACYDTPSSKLTPVFSFSLWSQSHPVLLITHRLMAKYFERGANVVWDKAEVKKKMLQEKPAINILYMTT